MHPIVESSAAWRERQMAAFGVPCVRSVAGPLPRFLAYTRCRGRQPPRLPIPEARLPLLALGSVRWRKVVRDLREHRVRSLLVVLSIAVGVMAVGTIAGANALLERNLANGYAATKPSSASLFTTVPFDQGLVDVVRSMPDVAEAEGRRSATARMVKPDGETVELALTALPDFEAQAMDLVSPESGTWPPRRGEIVFERSSRTVADLQEGRTITVQLGPDKTRTLVTGGFAHEPGGAPAYFFGQPSATSRSTPSRTWASTTPSTRCASWSRTPTGRGTRARGRGRGA